MLKGWQIRFVLPMVVALGTVVLFPTVYLFWMSLQQWVLTSPGRSFTGASNFIKLFNSATFWGSLGATGTYLVLSTTLMLALGMGMALAFARSGSGALRAIMVLPLVIPPIVAGFTWRFLLNGEIGFIGAWLLPMAGIEVNMLADPKAAMASIVIADVWSRTPFMFLIFVAAIQSIPRDLYEAARMDGASVFHEFRFITLPMLKGALFVAILFRLVDAINTFEIVYVMTKGGPGRATQLLSLLGWRTAFQEFNFGLAAALGVTMLVISMVGATIMFRRVMRPELGG
jgi:multiple sugar transport system permease protein